MIIPKDKSVLLIGSDGFLGSWFKDIFKDNGNELLCYDIKAGNDICNALTLPRFDYVINCAGIASPEKYMKDPLATMDVSYTGTKNVLDYCVRNKVESVLMFSSSEVYGTPSPESIPTTEDYIGTIPTRNSRSCYDIGKQVLETLCYIYHNKYKVPVKVVRPFNFYGPHMDAKDNRVLSNWMTSYLKGERIVVYGDGRQTRTLCYASDGIAMCLAAMILGKDGEVYNVGNPAPELSIAELAEVFCKILNYENKYELIEYPTQYPSDEPARRCPNIDKILKLGVQYPQVDLSVGLNKMLDYFQGEES